MIVLASFFFQLVDTEKVGYLVALVLLGESVVSQSTVLLR